MDKMLFTGASGFLGQTIKPLLSKSYDVTTCGRSASNDIVVDLSNNSPVLNEQYDIVLHAAAKAHTLPRTEQEIAEYFSMNVGGTINLCHALEHCSIPHTLIYISTVAVYGCDKGIDIDENYPLNGSTPYAQSKIKAEQFLQQWCNEHGCNLVILRPSLLAGHNATANLRAMTNGIRRGLYANIAGNAAIKSILLARDIASAIPVVINHPGIYNICDSKAVTFSELAKLIAEKTESRRPFTIPYSIAWILAKIGDIFGDRAQINTQKLRKIVSPLTFSNAKLRALGWEPTDVLSNYEV